MIRLAVATLLVVFATVVDAADSQAAAVPRVEFAKRLKQDVIWPGLADREALVILRFDVLASGKVANIRLAEGGFHEKRFVNAAIRGLEKSTWQPKRLDGRPVESTAMMQAVNFSIPNMEPGITVEFRNELVKVDDLLNKGDLAGGRFHAEWMLSEVVKLNYEYAVLQAQLAETYAKLGMTREAAFRAGMATARPSVSLPDFFQLQATVPPNNASNYLLPKDLVVVMLGLRMRLLADLGLFIDAMQSYYELAGLVELAPTDLRVVLANEMTAWIQGPEKLVGKVEVVGEDPWIQHLSRHRFTLDNVKGSVSYIDLKCGAETRAYEYKAGTDWNVPVEWGVCLATVKAAPGTTFDFVEYPDAPAAAPAL